MRPLLACMLVGLLLGADDPKDHVKKDKEKLQGAWKAVTVEAGGKPLDEGDLHRLIFSGDVFTIKKGEETMIKGKFTLDPSKKPKEIDMEFIETKRDNLRGKTALGIYEVDGDTLKWCWNKPDGKRPKEFSSEAADVHLLVTLKREKSK
ncbi:MAG: TIGR03067 domain-containing protein [Gemmataceae bacterium]